MPLGTVFFLLPCGAGSEHIALVSDAEVDILRHAGEYPGEHIQQIQGRDRVEVGKDGVDPDDPEHAGAQNDHNGGGHAAAQSAGGGDAGVHQGADPVGEGHDPQAVHAGVDDLGLVGKQAQELPAEDSQQHADQHAHNGGVQHTDVVALKDTLLPPRAPVAADKAGAGGVERGHHVEHQRIGIGGSRRAGDSDLVKRVQARLHEQVSHGEYSVLQSGGDADQQHTLGGQVVQPQLADIQTAGVLAVQQVDDDEQRRHPLCDGAGDSHALGRHTVADNEHQVQYHIQHARHRQIQQGSLGVAGGAEDTVAAVVDAHGRQAQGIELQVQHRAGEEFLLGVQQPQHRLGKKHAHQARQHAHRQTDQEGGVGGVLHVLVIAHAQPAGHSHIDAAAQTDQQSREQRDQRGGGAHRAQGHIGVVRILAGDGHIAEVEQHLQHLGHHQRQAEQQDIFPK